MKSSAVLRAAAASLSAALVLMVSGCSGADNETAHSDYRATSSMHEFMTWYLEPAADVLWDNAGYIVTEDGEEDLQPTTDEGWDHVRNHATIVAEAGNLLRMPGYAVPEADWMEYAHAMTDAALQARDAAQAQDADALFQAGANLYSVCRACHNRYVVEAGQ